jgi:hypothetical protein
MKNLLSTHRDCTFGEGGFGMQTTRVFLGRLLIVTIPLLPGVLELFHPLLNRSTGVFEVQYLGVGWWITLQMLGITLAVLLYLAVSHSIAGVAGSSAETVSRIGLGIFLLSCLAYYGVIGIGTGILTVHANDLAEAARVCLGRESSYREAIVSWYESPIGPRLLVGSSLGWIVGVVAAWTTT